MPLGAANGDAPRDHLVEQHAQRPDVRPRVHLLPACLLRRHVRGRADHGSRIGLQDGARRVGASQLRCRRRELRQPEVEHLHEAVGPEHHVLGLDVAVNDAGGVRGAQRGSNLNRDVERLADRQPCRGEPLPERLALDVLHRDVVLAVAGLAQRVDACRRSGD